MVERTAAGNANAAAVYAGLAKVEDTVTQIGRLVGSLQNAPPTAMVAQLVFDDIAAKIAAPDSSLDLSNSLVVQSVIDGTLVRTGLVLDPAIASGAAQVIAAGNEEVDQVPIKGDEAFLAAVRKTQAAAQGPVATQLADLAAGQAGIDNVVAANTGTALERQIANAALGTVVPVTAAIYDATVVQPSSGQAMLQFTVMLNRPPVTPVSLDYATFESSATEGEDYLPVSGSLYWAPGDPPSQTIEVPVPAGATFEPDKTVLVALWNPTHATITRWLGRGVITSDNPFIYAAPSDDQPNALVLSVDGQYVSLMRNGELVFDGDFSHPLPVSITGAQDVPTSLTVRLVSPRDLFSAGVQFEGRTPGDSLVIDDSVVRAVQHHRYRREFGDVQSRRDKHILCRGRGGYRSVRPDRDGASGGGAGRN